MKVWSDRRAEQRVTCNLAVYALRSATLLLNKPPGFNGYRPLSLLRCSGDT